MFEFEIVQLCDVIWYDNKVKEKRNIINIDSGVIIAISVGYLLGCFQSSYLLVKYTKKKDIRSFGSGNAGASNTVSNFGFKLGLLATLLDIVKAIVAICLMKEYILLFGLLQQKWVLLYICGAMVIIGHMFCVLFRLSWR
ncbi:glycerol-3-phosphate acyltransferase PlsY [Granulicatella balaenopterae]|uniref:Glycerol-3-phosphate acyltransferase PlsY n=1 Tax=Granulicatella balaenopterae TaxID=137733 RepID=A0A1H9PAT5_9LACT|nr:glycerol-3-phosphate acyltransferase [Granulicatella balaenopterae]SER45241.1 glycerol-3-phosphate acyltransferase PlsY [Granulicatella balaenopterae]